MDDEFKANVRLTCLKLAVERAGTYDTAQQILVRAKEFETFVLDVVTAEDGQ